MFVENPPHRLGCHEFRGEEANPAGPGIARHLLAHGRDPRLQGEARLRRDGDDDAFGGPHMFHHDGDVADKSVDMARHQRVERQGRAAIRHMQQFGRWPEIPLGSVLPYAQMRALLPLHLALR